MLDTVISEKSAAVVVVTVTLSPLTVIELSSWETVPWNLPWTVSYFIMYYRKEEGKVITRAIFLAAATNRTLGREMTERAHGGS